MFDDTDFCILSHDDIDSETIFTHFGSIFKTW